MKNPTIATLLNIIPGLGYIYIGGRKLVFGLLLMFMEAASIISAFDPTTKVVPSGVDSPELFWNGIALLVVVLTLTAFMYDGYASASQHNEYLSKDTSK